MPDLPYGKFFWNDYAADLDLASCSLAAQGLWMRMLCIAAHHKPRKGYVAQAGKRLDAEGIGRIVAQPAEVVQGLLDELKAANVYSVDTHGRIYSRRMLRDAARTEKAEKSGAMGGNPKLKQHADKTGEKGVSLTKSKTAGLSEPRKGKRNQRTSGNVPTDNSIKQGVDKIETPNGTPTGYASVIARYNHDQPVENTQQSNARLSLEEEEEEEVVDTGLSDRTERGELPKPTDKGLGSSPSPSPPRTPPTAAKAKPTESKLDGWRADVERVIGAQSYQTFLATCRVTRAENIVTITGRSFVVAQLEKRFDQTINAAIRKHFGKETRTRYAIAAEQPEPVERIDGAQPQ
jgi:hypothetical protein